MALSFLQAAASTTDTNSYTFSSQNLGTAAADRYIVVAIATRKSGATTTISSVSVGGVSATIVVQQSNTVTNTCVSGIAIAAVPSDTTGDVVVTFGASVLRCGIALYRADNLFSATAFDTDNSAVQDPTVSLDIPGPGFAIGTATTGTATSTTWTGITEDHDTVLEAANSFTSASLSFGTGQVGLSLKADFAINNNENVGVFASWRFNGSGQLLLLGVG